MSSLTANLYPAPGVVPTTNGVGSASVHSSQAVSASSSTEATGRLATFEGVLKRAGLIAGVVLTDIVKYVIPVASVVAIADPATAGAVGAFTASVKLVQAAVISVQQKWAADGSTANAQKLADVLAIVEEPIVTMFSQVGVKVDTAYVTHLVNGVVAILNAQPAAVLPTSA